MLRHSTLTQELLKVKETRVIDVPERIANLIKMAGPTGVQPEGGLKVGNYVFDGINLIEVKAYAIDAPAALPEMLKAKKAFVLGKSSEKELIGVEPKLVKVVRFAIQLTTQDFMVYDGIRSIAEQKHYVAIGTSKTMQSKHLEGLAVDLVPWINGKPTWDWEGCYQIALAMDQAATQLGCADRITWGGAWDRTLADFEGDSNAYKRAVQDYRARHSGPDFIDGPHFEWRK